MDAIDRPTLSRWIKDATGRMGSRTEGVARAAARGGKVSYASWQKAESPDELERSNDATLRGIALGLGLDSEALVDWRRDGGAPPELPDRSTGGVEILPGVQREFNGVRREFDDLRARVGRMEETLLRVLEAVTAQRGAGDEPEGGAA